VEVAAVGSVVLKDPELLHRNRFGDDGSVIVSVILPNAAVDALGYRASALHDWRWQHAGPAALSGLRLASALRRADGRAVEECLHDLLGGFLSHPPGAATPAPERLRRIRDRLHEEPDPPPSVRELAAAEGMHPVSLGRAFRRAFGCSITRYRQRVRAGLVARALAAGGEALAGIALDGGFSDQSHMNRVFRRELGVPPGTYRRSFEPPAAGLESFKTEWLVAI
jgi:AraC-like DNA-binding protein